MNAPLKPSDVAPKRAGRLRRWLPWVAFVAVIVLIGGMLLTWLLKLQPDQIISVSGWFRKASQVGALVQVGASCLIVLSWRQIVGWGFRHGFVARHELRAVLAMRWRAAGVLVVYLVLVPIGAGNVARFILGLFS